jgi:hypothetical protein
MSTFTQTNANANANANAHANTIGKRTTFTMEERKVKSQRAESWNGKQKHGSYARHRQVQEAARLDRRARKDAESAGEFVTVRRGRKKPNTATVAPTMPRIIPRFAALVADDSDDEETSPLPVITTHSNSQTEPTPVTPRQVSWGPLNKSAIVTPTVKLFGLKNGSWADECDSDDEE